MTKAVPMNRNRLYALPLLLALAACSGGNAPQRAEFVPPVPTQQDFGDLRVHFNALPTLALSEAVAREYGVRREDGTALVVIALRRGSDNGETTAEGKVEAIARDLAGKQQVITFRNVRTGDYVDHIGTLKVGARDSYRFAVTVQADGRRETLQFQRNF